MVSIIIPVYNTGIYLRNCIESLLNQTYSDIEIVIVDDGSEKETADLCDLLCEIDNRIIVYHVQNGGVSKARNFGLEKATGELIGFLDSDDTFTQNTIEKSIKYLEITKSDIVFFDSTTIFEEGNEVDTFRCFSTTQTIESKSISPKILVEIAGAVWRAIYRKEIIDAYNIKFPCGIKFSEDRIFNIEYLSYCENGVAYLKEPLYNRLIRKGSACFRYYPDITSQLEKLRDYLIPLVKRRWGELFVLTYENQIAAQVLAAITNITSSDNSESALVVKRMLEELVLSASLKDCIRKSDNKDSRKKFFIRENWMILYIIGRLTNYYHKLCHIGQYQK